VQPLPPAILDETQEAAPELDSVVRLTRSEPQSEPVSSRSQEAQATEVDRQIRRGSKNPARIPWHCCAGNGCVAASLFQAEIFKMNKVNARLANIHRRSSAMTFRYEVDSRRRKRSVRSTIDLFPNGREMNPRNATAIEFGDTNPHGATIQKSG
jgi:hypothetical protein